MWGFMQCLGHYILQNVNIKSISSIKLLETMDGGKRSVYFSRIIWWSISIVLCTIMGVWLLGLRTNWGIFTDFFNRGQMICMARFLWSHLIIGYLKIFKQPMVKSICTQVTQYPGKHSPAVFLKHIFWPFFSLGLSNHHRHGRQSADYDIFWVKMFSWQGEWGAIFRGRVRGLCLLLPPRFCRERWSETQCLYQYELCPAPALLASIIFTLHFTPV